MMHDLIKWHKDWRSSVRMSHRVVTWTDKDTKKTDSKLCLVALLYLICCIFLFRDHAKVKAKWTTGFCNITMEQRALCNYWVILALVQLLCSFSVPFNSIKELRCYSESQNFLMISSHPLNVVYKRELKGTHTRTHNTIQSFGTFWSLLPVSFIDRDAWLLVICGTLI